MALALLPLGLVGEASGHNAAAVVVIRGGGWGHGVGLSQYGAYGRAVAGATSTQIVEAYYPGARVGPLASAPAELRVGLGSAPTTDISLTGPQFVVADGQLVALAPAGTTLRAVRADGLGPAVALEAPGVCDPGACVGSEIAIPLTVGTPIGLGLTGRHYQRGTLVLRPDGAGLSATITGLTPDTYLYGLAEMPAAWPAGALEAQAIAARSYAAHRAATNRAAGAAHDLVATTADQVYAGADKELAPGAAAWMAAVDATSGRYVTRNGQPVLAFYSSSNGGWSESASYVFGGADPAAAYADPWDAWQNPNAAWIRRFPGADVASWLRPVTGDIGELVDIVVVGPTGASGRVDQAVVEVTGTTGTARITGPQLRDSLNAGAPTDQQVLSTRFTVEVVPIPDLPPLPDLSQLPAAPDPGAAEPTTTTTVAAPVDPLAGLVATALADHPAPRADDAGAPRGAVALVGGDLGQMAIGWAVDDDHPVDPLAGNALSVAVRVTLDGVPVTVAPVLANQPTGHGPAATDPSLAVGFAVPITVAPGLHAVCAEGLDTARSATLVDPAPADRWVVLGCQLIEGPAAP